MSLPPALPSLPKRDGASGWQLALGIFSVCILALGITAFFLFGRVSSSPKNSVSINWGQVQYLLWIAGFLLLLVIPSIVYAARRLAGNYSPAVYIHGPFGFVAAALLALWVGILFVGNNLVAWHLPDWTSYPLDFLAILLPILIFVILGLYGLRAGGKQRLWGLINFSSFVTIPKVIALEMLLFIAAIVAGFAWLVQQPQYAPYLNIFSSPQGLSPQNLQTLFLQLTPLLKQPGLYAVILLLFSVLVPLIEEAFKPLGVWFLAGKSLTPSQGFAAGLVCGAVFGMVESLTMMNITGGNVWTATAVARVGTGLLHTFTASLSGWALAKSWQDQKYWRILMVYFGTVLLHGTWNFFAVVMGISQVSIPINSVIINSMEGISSWALYILAIFMLVGLILANVLLRKQSEPPELPALPVIDLDSI